MLADGLATFDLAFINELAALALAFSKYRGTIPAAQFLLTVSALSSALVIVFDSSFLQAYDHIVFNYSSCAFV